MKRQISLLLIITTLASLSALDYSAGGELSVNGAVGLPAVGSNKSNDGTTDNDLRGNFLAGNTILKGNFDAWQGASSLHADVALNFDALGAFSQSLDFVSGLENFSFKLKEAWFDYNGGWWAIRLGRQIQSWGKADGLEVCDILCPKDSTSLLSGDYADSRLGIDSLRLSANWSWGSADAYWIPFFTPSTLPLKDGNILKSILIPSSINIEENAVAINPITDSNIALPETKIQNGQYAAKVSAYLPFADFSLYGFYGWDKEPLLSYTANFGTSSIESISINGTYERLGMIGADAAIPLGETVLRLETAFFPQKAFATSGESQIKTQAQNKVAMATNAYLESIGQPATEEIKEVQTSVRRNQLKALAGIDWMPAGWTLTAQYYIDCLFGDLEIADRDAFVHQATLSVSKSFLGETLDLSLAGMIEFNDFSSAIKFEANYSLSDQITLFVGCNYFFPGSDSERTGTYGAYKKLSCVTFGGKFGF